ncbi:MAG: nucleotidyltransferase domain-containing protein, partial [Anaerolineae bacterium]
MVFNQRQLEEHLDRYLTEVRRKFRVQRAILYGSYAAGAPRPDSDIDLIVLSEDFRGMPRLRRHQELGWLAWQARTAYISPLGFTPEEYVTASPASLLGEVRESGITVFETTPEKIVAESRELYGPGSSDISEKH